MPKTAMYEYGLALPAEYQIGLSREIGAMQPKPMTHRVHHSTHTQFRRRIVALDSLHRSPSDFRRLHLLTLAARPIMSAPIRVWMPDHAFFFGSPPMFVHRLQTTNSCA
jgi:hypothetical protein